MKNMTCLLLTLIALPAFAVDDPNLVTNPGFEALGDNGQPADWSMPGGYTLSDEQPHSGAHCLKYVNTDEQQYHLSSTPVALEPGLQYEMSAWVRTEDVAGSGDGATVCVEWYGDDRYLGGSYPSGYKGTNEEWKQVHVITGPVPPGATRYTLHCYFRKGFTGTAWFDDVTLKRYRPPLVGHVITDAYRNTVAGGTITVHVGLNLKPNLLTVDQVQASLAIVDQAGKLTMAGAPVLTEDSATWTIDGAKLPVGQYTLQVSAQAGGQTSDSTATLQKVATMADRKAWIDEHERLILDSQPFFPLGTYWSAVKPDDVERYAKSPFNCLMPYGGASLEMLDLLDSKDLKLIYTIKDLYHGTNYAPKDIQTVEDERAAIEKVVAEKGDHPAIIAWYINDEMPLTMLEQLTAHRDWLEELDPGRPTWVVLYQVDQVRGYLPTFDVIGTDPYPIPSRPASTALTYARKTNEAVFGSRAVWMVPQIFDWASYHAEREQHPPSYAEMRSMAWSCIAAGANGLIFYSYFDLWKMDKAVEDGGKAKVREPFDERWADVCRMAQEIAANIPVLLAAETTPEYQLNAPDDVACRVWSKDGEVWLLAVNAGTETAQATVTWDRKFSTAEDVLPDQDGNVAVVDRVTTLGLPGLGVKLVRLK